MQKLFLKTTSLLAVMLCFINVSIAQDLYRHPHGTPNTNARTTFGQGSNIDVIYHRCNWRISPDSPSTTAPVKYLRGNVTTYFKTTLDNVSAITFDFNNVHTIDSVKYQGVNLLPANIVWNTSKILQLNLPLAIATTGTIDSIAIYYKGVPPAPTGQALGYQKGGSSTNNYVYTLSESYEDRDWWPCKHDMNDKIDSIDINVSVPSTFWVAANGKMVDSAITGSNRIFKFQHRYPIASYLVAIGVAKYVRYYRAPVLIGGVNVPVVYNLFPGKTTSTYNSILTALDKSRLELTAFGAKYGDYPFKNEKHGYYEFGFGGGMEHQTFSGMGGSALTSWSIIAHELAHQWFGDKVTTATWNHLWVNEGFARYNEIVAAELVSGLGNAVTHRTSIKSTARSTSTTPVYITNATTSDFIWTTNNDNAIYERGAMVVSQLRKLLGDTKFFQACNNYLNDPLLAYKGATTEDVQRHMEAQFGASMAPYFNAWIYGSGTPSYTVNWNNTGNSIRIQLNQTRTAGASVTYFPMPIVLRVANSGNTQSTTLVIYDKGDSLFVAGNGIGAGVAGNLITFNLAFTPSAVTFDVNNETMATGTVTKSTTLRTALTNSENTIVKNLNIYPNPTSEELNVVTKEIVKDGLVNVIDINGKTIMQKGISGNVGKLNVAKLPNGTYLIQIKEKDTVLYNERIIIQH